MTVYILDDDTPQQNRRDWSFLTGKSQLQRVSRDGHKLTSVPGGQELAADATGVVFIHSSYCPPAELRAVSCNYQKLLLILLGAGGIPNGPRGSLFWSIGKAVSKPPERDDYFAERAKEFLADYEKTGTPDFRKLEPDTDAALAFQLLREAKRECADKDTAKLAGITIHAPMSLENWLKPFGDDEVGRLRQVARLILEVGDEAATERVKNAMSDPTALKTAVSEYLQVIPASVSQP